ncbi:hypothetical protein MP638_006910 [Amoeboaphelidium occidentale]|nr:hypothetical protein MP638_006910 [Amoeboaphelidium occidentale]
MNRLLLHFHKDLLLKFPSVGNNNNNNRSLLVCSSGLGWERVLFSYLESYQKEQSIILLLNGNGAADYEYLGLGIGLSSSSSSSSGSSSSSSRRQVYLKGGIFYGSLMILLDILNGALTTDLITGIVVFNAHTVEEYSIESFILHLVTTKNAHSFVLGLSTAPDAFLVGGFCKLEKLVNYLGVVNVELLPRFHMNVLKELECDDDDLELTEYHVKLSQSMEQIQMNIMNIMSEIFKELKKCSLLLEDDYDLDAILLMKININYNTLNAKARQLVNDLRTLRSLLRYLLCYDCIAFYEYLVNILESANKEHSAFVLVDDVDLLLKTAKDRIVVVLQDKLDYNPKYEVMEDILKEIKDTTVLITTSDSKSAKCIMEYLKGLLQGDKKLYIKKEYNRFMKIRKEKKKDEGTKSSNTGNNHPATSAPGGRFNKRRRVRGGAASVVADRKKGTAEQQIEYLESITNINGDEAVIEIMSSSSSSSSEDEGETKKDETIRTRYFIQYQTLKIYIHVYSSSVPFDDEQILYNLNPPVILMFDPNPTFIRQIEVYKALNKNKELKVHFMVYEESYEEQLYLTKLKDEKLGFEKLIREKSQMMFQKAKDKVLNNQHGSIVVDTREFRSSLPMVLHTKGFQIIPATIEVGDYVLTKDICVERKSVPDLIGSFSSGRLYTQVENMCHHYKTPVLLIEFDENRGFTFDLGRRYYKAENDFDKGIEWKLVLLTMNFPQLRIIWSGSLHASVEVFMDLKQNKEDPDIDTVLGTGQDTLVDTEDLMSIVPVEVLQQLPGMVPVSYKYICKEVKSLKELVSLNEDKLDKILGNKEKAKALHEFMNKSV